jgi:hypothetical protein
VPGTSGREDLACGFFYTGGGGTGWQEFGCYAFCSCVRSGCSSVRPCCEGVSFDTGSGSCERLPGSQGCGEA